MGPSPKHGRRAADTECWDISRSHGSGTDQVFRLQLKPSIGPDFKPSLQTVEGEYATRYLEQLGVAPARQTLDLVHRNIPLTHKNVTTTLRAKGHVNDELLVTVPPVAIKFTIPKVIQTQDLLQMGLANQEATPDGAQQDEPPSPTGPGPESATSPAEIPGMQFRNLAARYLYPFNLDISLAQVPIPEFAIDLRPSSAERPDHGARHSQCSVTLQHQTSLGQRIQHAGRITTCPPSPRGRVRQGGASPRRKAPEAHHTSSWDPDLLRLEICEELLQELVVTPEVVLTLFARIEVALADWYRSQAPETLKGRLTEDEFQDTLELLTDVPRIKFFITLINFLHEEFIRGSPSFPHHLEDKMVKQAMVSRCNSRASLASRASSMHHPAHTRNMPQQPAQPEKHDLGYKLWLRERSSPGAATPTAANPSWNFSKSASLAATPSMKPQPSQHALRNTQADSVEPPPQKRHSHKLLAANLSVASASSTVAHAPHASHHHVVIQPQRSQHAQPQAVSFGHLPAGTEPNSKHVAPRHVHHSTPQAIPSAYAQSRPTSASNHSVFAHVSVSEPTIHEATERSMQHLRSVKVLRAAAVESNSGPSRLTKEDEAKLQQARLYMLQKEFASLYNFQRSSRAGMFFSLPLVLVTGQLLVQMLFTGLYRLWCKTEEGVQSLLMMEDALIHLFDPHGYLQRNLSILQSAPAAVSVMSKYPHKSHEPERFHFADVSPLLRAVMTEPASAGARKLLHQAANSSQSRASRQHKGDREFGEQLLGYWSNELVQKGPLNTQLSTAQRDALFRELHAMLSGPAPPVLSSLGEAAFATSRDSWIAKPR